MRNRRAFTLLEVLISITLMGIVVLALFSAVDMMRDSNEHLAGHLEKSKKITQATKVFYSDLMASDGNITIQKDEFSRVCIENTRNSLYALPSAKVCWVVLKKNNTLARIEGNGYQLPTGVEDRVEIDPIMPEIKLFDVLAGSYTIDPPVERSFETSDAEQLRKSILGEFQQFD